MLVPTIKLLDIDFRIKIEKLMSVFWFFGPFFDYFFYCPKFQKWNFIKNPFPYTQNTTLYDIDFPQKIGFLRFFFKKVSIDGFTHFSSKIHPKFSKNRLFHIPKYIIYLWSEFYARSNNQTIRIFG